LASFNAFEALSTGRLAGLPDRLRIQFGDLAAWLSGEAPSASDFLKLKRRASAIEREFTQALSAAEQSNVADLHGQDFEEEIAFLLFEPKPPPFGVEGEVVEPVTGTGGSLRLFAPTSDTAATKSTDSVEMFYDYFYSAYVRGSQSRISPELLKEVLDRAVGQACDPNNPSQDETASPLPEGEISRRKVAFDKLAAELRELDRRFVQSREEKKQAALADVERSLELYAGKIRSLQSDPVTQSSLPNLIVQQSIGRMRASAGPTKVRLGNSFDNLRSSEIISRCLEKRLRAIDEVYGDRHRAALKRQEREYTNWGKVRDGLVPAGQARVELVQLTEDLRRNQLRRELIAGSVQCVIGKAGGKLLRASTAEASGPPPYFMTWIAHLDDASPINKPDSTGPYIEEAAPERSDAARPL